MDIEIPEFLLEMSNQINTQDNRCTADPIWQVMCKRTRPTAEDYSDRFSFLLTHKHLSHLVLSNRILSYVYSQPLRVKKPRRVWLSRWELRFPIVSHFPH